MTTYDLSSVKLPRLTGTGLKLFAAALDNPTASKLMLGRLMRDGGMTKLGEMQLNEPPTMNPNTFEQAAGSAISLAQLEQLAAEAGAASPLVPYRTTIDYADAYRQGTIIPTDVARQILDAINKSDSGRKPLRAFIANDHEDVLAQAEASTRRFKQGQPLSILDGVPVAIKDEVDQLPYPTTVGTSFLGKTPAADDSTVAARLRAAGALLIGKANMYEIGINPEGFNLHHGTARNPFNLDNDTGGSSSGSAAAVAAGLCPVAIGADGGGSIRIPAAHCGLVGLKATYGRISEYGAAPLCWSVAHLGPIGASVADVALAYAVIAGPDPKDAVSQRQPTVKLDEWCNADLSGLTLGVFRPWFNHAAEEIVGANKELLAQFIDLGAKVKEIEIPELDAMRVAHAVSILSEMAASMRNLSVDYKNFSAPVRTNLALGRALSSMDYLQAQRMRSRAIAIFNQVFVDVDVIITPATAVTAPAIPDGGLSAGWSDLSVVTELMRFIFPSNLTGNPAITFPAGYDSSGMPIGMQAIGRNWEEHVLLRVAFAAEQNVPRKLPGLHHQILD